ncbi:MAG: iron-containing alcohol dehydrogenase [Pirellulaceae bacterium]
MQPFEFELKTRILCGAGKLAEIGATVDSLGAKRVLLVTDPGILDAGYPERAAGFIQDQGIAVQIFDGARENPTTEHVKSGVVVAREFKPDLLIGLGGGSSMDCAKGINFLYSCGGEMQDYWGVGLATGPLLPMIAVPTTSGTGSELQSFALISDAKTHKKMACGDKRASCRVAILDPELTLTQPALVTAVTGIDAISHAVETFVSKRRNTVSTLFSKEAWRLLSRHFEMVLRHPDDLEARAGMQLGAAWAGLAIENSMLGAAHSLANPLTARHGTIHGQSVGISLPHVVRFNGHQVNDWYRELLQISESNPSAPSPDLGAEGLADYLTQMVENAGLPTRLTDCGVVGDEVSAMASEAASQWTAQFNPRQVSVDDFEFLYKQAL